MRCPDLAMRMRIAGAHHRTPVFEDLDVVNVFQAAEFSVLPDPCMDDWLDLLWRHRCQGQVVSRREADDPTGSGLALRNNQSHPPLIEAFMRGLRFERSEIVFKDECG